MKFIYNNRYFDRFNPQINSLKQEESESEYEGGNTAAAPPKDPNDVAYPSV